LRPIHLSRLRVPGGEIDDLARLHAEWALGLDRFAFLRAERLAAGVPADTVPEDLVESQGGQWTFKFTLPERAEVSRTSAIKISNQDDAVLVEHFVWRDGRPDLIIAPTASAPDVVLWLLDKAAKLEPASLRSHASTVIDEPEVPSFVDDILSPTRTVPIIVVAVENALHSTLVDANELALRLAGMATVYQLASVRASYRLRDELVNRHMPDKFGCYNGGVRVLRPGIESHDNPYDHLLLLPVRLLGLLAKSRSEQVAGIFCELLAEGEDPRRWLRELEPGRPPPPVKPKPVKPVMTSRLSRPEPYPRPEPSPLLRGRLSTESTRPELDGGEPLTSKLGSIRGLSGLGVLESPTGSGGSSEPAGLAAHSAAPEPSVRVAESCEDLGVQSSTRIEVDEGPSEDDREDERDEDEEESELEDDDEEEGELEDDEEEEEEDEPARPSPRASAKASLPRPSADWGSSTWTALADDVTAAFQLAAEQEQQFEALQAELADARKQLRRAQQERDELAGPPSSASEALARAEATFPDKLVVLRSARASAQDSPYRDPGRVLFVLILLANCDASSFGEVLHKAVGSSARWKPRDSPETVAKFGKDRTFTDSTRTPKLFTRHVTLGHGISAKKCLQIYYDVLGDGRVEIAWCGDHRPTVSEDT